MTCISGIGAAGIVTTKDTADYLARTHSAVPLRRLSGLNGAGVWIRCAAVTAVQRPIPENIPSSETVRAVI